MGMDAMAGVIVVMAGPHGPAASGGHQRGHVEPHQDHHSKPPAMLRNDMQCAWLVAGRQARSGEMGIRVVGILMAASAAAARAGVRHGAPHRVPRALGRQEGGLRGW